MWSGHHRALCFVSGDLDNNRGGGQMNKKLLISQSGAIMIAGFLVLFITGGSRFAIGLIVKPMADELAWGRSTLGFAIAIFLLISAMCMPIAGRLTDRFSARGVLALGAVISALGIGLMSTVVTPWQAFVLYGLVFAIGNGLASLTPVSVLITRWFPGRTGLANGIAVSGMGMGQLLMVAVLAIILVQIGWRSVFVWLGIFNFLLLPIVWFAITGSGQPASQGEGDKASGAVSGEGLSLAEAMRTKRFWLLLGGYAICGFQDFFVSTHVVAFAMDKGVETFVAGNLLALMGLTGVVGVIAAGAWSDRTGPVWPFLACFVVRLLLFILILFDQRILSVNIFALVFGITFWMAAPLTVIFVRDAFGTRDLGAIAGLVTMVHHIAGGVGAYVGALLFDRGGNYDAAFVMMIIVSLMAIGVSVTYWLRDRSGPATASM